jgi:hypothetical protein
MSVALPIAGLSNPKVRFWCNYVVGLTSAGGEDMRLVEVVDAATSEPLAAAILGTDAPAAPFGFCDAPGVWHQHEIVLDPAWGSVRVRFTFATFDEFDNAHEGWFIDDFELVNEPEGAEPNPEPGSGPLDEVAGAAPAVPDAAPAADAAEPVATAAPSSGGGESGGSVSLCLSGSATSARAGGTPLALAASLGALALAVLIRR